MAALWPNSSYMCACDAVSVVGNGFESYQCSHITALTIFRRQFNKVSSMEHVSRVRRLYKLIFRVHRALPAELRVMGDNYARDEFKRHKNCNPEEARIFLNEWTDYAISLAKQMKPLQQAKKKKVGEYLDPKLLDHMTEDQLYQLYELHKAATDPSENIDKPSEDKK